MVAAAALAVLDEIESHDLIANCGDRSAQLVAGLAALDGVSGVRGRGLLLAALLEEDIAAEVAGRALEAGLVVNAVRPDAVRFAPPLSVSASEVDEGVARFARALSG